MTRTAGRAGAEPGRRAGSLIVLAAAPAFACGGLIGPNGAVNLLRTTTLRRLPRRRGALRHGVPVRRWRRVLRQPHAPARGPSKVEKGGDWTLQRLIRETEPSTFAMPALAAPAALAAAAEVLMQVRIDALDITVLRAVAQRGRDVGHRARLPPPARRARGPRLLRRAQPDLPRRGLRCRRGRRARPGDRRRDAGPHHHPDRRTRGSRCGSSRSARPAEERVDADVYLLTDRTPGPAAGPDRRQRPVARPQRAGDGIAPRRPPLGSRAWTGSRREAWLTKVRIDAAAAAARVRPRGRRHGRPGAVPRRGRPGPARSAASQRRRAGTPAGWRSASRSASSASAGSCCSCGASRRSGRPDADGRWRRGRDRPPAGAPRPGRRDRAVARAGRDRRGMGRGRPRWTTGPWRSRSTTRTSRRARVTVPVGVPITFVIRQHRSHRPRVDRRRRGRPRAPPDRHGGRPRRRARPRSSIPAGDTVTTTVTFASAGSQQYICHLPGHEAYGMVGTVTIAGP